MSNLSLAAQAVLDAATEGFWRLSFNSESNGAAAALRAAANQWKNEIRKQPNTEFIRGIKNCIDALNELADELESQS
jgi:hypothetical protein